MALKEFHKIERMDKMRSRMSFIMMLICILYLVLMIAGMVQFAITVY